MLQLIVAGTADQAARLAKEKGLKTSEYCYVYSRQQLMGTRGKQVWATGTYYARTNWPELEEMIQLREHTLVFRHI